jgi:opacity protein-like surface antigen
LFSQDETNGLLTAVSKGEIGIAGGCSYYTGDFNESFIPYMVEPMAGLFYRHNFNKYINLRIQFSGGIIKGDSRNYEGGLQGFPPGTNLAFKRNFWAGKALAEFNFFPYSSVNTRREQIFTPFLLIGVGYAHVAKNSIQNPSLPNAALIYPMLYDSLTTAGSIIIPVGFGFKFSPAKKWTIGAEYVFYKTSTDRIDHYINRSSKDSYNIFNKDWISTICLTLSYRFVDSSPCQAYKSNKSTKKRQYKGINKELQ